MAGHLVAPRPVRLGTGTSVNLPFFLSNALAAPEPSPVGSCTSASPRVPQASPSAVSQKVAPKIPIPAPSRDDEMPIEDLAANIRLDDEPLPARRPLDLDRGTSSPSALDKHTNVQDASAAPPRYELLAAGSSVALAWPHYALCPLAQLRIPNLHVLTSSADLQRPPPRSMSFSASCVP
jgi:hypothetical protein